MARRALTARVRAAAPAWTTTAAMGMALSEALTGCSVRCSALHTIMNDGGSLCLCIHTDPTTQPAWT